MRWMHFVVYGVLLVCVCDGQVVRFNLGSQTDIAWTVTNQNNSISIPATVPGGIYTDLQAAKVLGQELFYRFNDKEYRWVAHDNWTYSTSFSVPAQVLEKGSILIVFDGLDTVADVTLNDVTLASVDNMFLRHVISVKDVLKAEDNHLVVKFTSPILAAKERFDEQAKTYIVPPSCVSNSFKGECHANHIRKMQASFAWDWGPAFPSSGIWKPVSLEAFDVGVVRDVIVETTPSEIREDWNLNVTAFVESPATSLEASVKISLEAKNGKVLSNTTTSARLQSAEYNAVSKLNTFIYQVQVVVPQVDIDLWWPNEFGNATQPARLHNLHVELVNKQGAVEDQKDVKIGFRTVELIQEDITPGVEGKSFYFKVNGIPIFVKGSNWIPAHILPELGYREGTVRHLLESVRDTHQNILRVWGGGVYESDLFYSLADEYGILIWQDMMFACSMYQATPPVLESTAQEVRQQIRRLQHHASIAVWAGNNENEAALRGNWYWEQTLLNFERYRKDYVELYVNNFKPIFSENDRTRTYLISSPSNGVESEKEGYIAKDPYDARYGDVHHYNYYSDPWVASNYPYTRLASEYGFQGWPSEKTMDFITEPDDRSPYSDFFSDRQHLLLGNTFNLALIKRHLNVPITTFLFSPALDEYRIVLYYSQIMQAIAVQTETEKYRRDRSLLTPNNEGQTMGAMYWQLNDVWQAPSWSSIEFGGKWKMLHYFARRFFSPVLVSPYVEKGTLTIHLVSDLLNDVPNATFRMTVYSWDSFVPKNVYLEQIVTVVNATSTEIFSQDLASILDASGCPSPSCYIHVTLSDGQPEQKILSDNFVYPTSFKDVNNFKVPIFSIRNVTKVKESTVSFFLTSDVPAACVWLDTSILGVFSDNGFNMFTSSRNLSFTSISGLIDVESFQGNLTIQTVQTPLSGQLNQSPSIVLLP